MITINFYFVMASIVKLVGLLKANKPHYVVKSMTALALRKAGVGFIAGFGDSVGDELRGALNHCFYHILIDNILQSSNISNIQLLLFL